MTGDVGAISLEAQRRLEDFYALPPQPAVSDFLVKHDEARDLPGDGSRTLVHEEAGELSLGVVLEPEVTSCLEDHDPRRRIDRSNVGQYCTLVEEVSHFVFLTFCAGSERRVSELELELQAEIDKYLSLVLLVSLQNEGAVSTRLRELLFRRYQLRAGLSAVAAERYHVASGLAYRYCGFLEAAFLKPARLHELRRESRRFYRLGQRGKLERISALPSAG